ncbi:MAG: hypothetical protein ACTHLO_20585, partial [Pseudolabrys sp.]
DKKEVSGQEFILDQLQSIASGIQRLSTAQSKGIMRPIALVSRGDINACMQGVTVDEAEALAESVRALDGVDDVAIDNRSPTHQHIAVKLKQPDNEAPEDVLALLSPRSRNIRGMRNGRFIELFKKPPRQSGGGAKRT